MVLTVLALAGTGTSAYSQINISGTINQSTAVVSVSQPDCSDCSPKCKDTIEVNDGSAFQVGDRALIIQMKGATINTAKQEPSMERLTLLTMGKTHLISRIRMMVLPNAIGEKNLVQVEALCSLL